MENIKKIESLILIVFYLRPLGVGLRARERSIGMLVHEHQCLSPRQERTQSHPT